MNSGHYVDNKDNEYWVWLAIDRKAREIVACYVVAKGVKPATKLAQTCTKVLPKIMLFLGL